MRLGENNGCVSRDGVLASGLQPAVQVVRDAVGAMAVMDDQFVVAGRRGEEALELALLVHGRKLDQQLLLVGIAEQGLVVQQPEKASTIDVAQVGGGCTHYRALRRPVQQVDQRSR